MIIEKGKLFVPFHKLNDESKMILSRSLIYKGNGTETKIEGIELPYFYEGKGVIMESLIEGVLDILNIEEIQTTSLIEAKEKLKEVLEEIKQHRIKIRQIV